MPNEETESEIEAEPEVAETESQYEPEQPTPAYVDEEERGKGEGKYKSIFAFFVVVMAVIFLAAISYACNGDEDRSGKIKVEYAPPFPNAQKWGTEVEYDAEAEGEAEEADAEEAYITSSGKCGSSLTWSLDSDGTLVIDGTGKMFDWEDLFYVPWSEYVDYVRTVEIKEGVTSIGNWAFANCGSLESITIPAPEGSYAVEYARKNDIPYATY